MSTSQPTLPIALTQPQPPRLPEPREQEPYSDYLTRCVAVAARYWAERRAMTERDVLLAAVAGGVA